MPKSMNRTDHGGLLSGSTLKWLAILLMLIDHVGASLLEVFVLNGYSNSPLAGLTGNVDFWWKVDRVLRYIGRSAFPIFCFLLVEGAVHTRDIRRYAGRMIAFAFVSELPFDLALRNHFPWWAHQNVFFTLALGLSAILVFQRSAGREWRSLAALGAAAILAEVCKTDYGATGVLVITLMYLLRENRAAALAVSYVLLAVGGSIELYALPGFLALLLYNGKRGRQPKRFFYWFYPVHLLALWGIGNFVLPYAIGKI